MPRHSRLCPARPRRARRFPALALPCAAALMAATPSLAETQGWSVHAFGLKVGELRLTVSENATSYTGSGGFRTTGLAGVLRRIRFSVSARGRISQGSYRPITYDGSIDTGRRVSETRLEYSGTLPVKVAGAQDPATPIPEADLRGAHDPMTLMWQVLQDQDAKTLCQLSQTQYDGTRLVRITLTSRSNDGDSVTCSGTYDRIGGYSAEELAEMKTSPISVTYRNTGATWRATQLRVKTRHGSATLYRQD
ncbi:Protein of unknown function [Shimia aestuarii]|uniref:DUF3108 domain-containing protein n=2 Tax=Shimia aestuarii TaxID=254406 RepID=A0A1I4RX91_9RHOB|nr:DUF3108 domain-containing protein [Shimia aestuarii]SFM56630.1 Protein of unknown function [Shimia aestuarii]